MFSDGKRLLGTTISLRLRFDVDSVERIGKTAFLAPLTNYAECDIGAKHAQSYGFAGAVTVVVWVSVHTLK